MTTTVRSPFPLPVAQLTVPHRKQHRVSMSPPPPLLCLRGIYVLPVRTVCTLMDQLIGATRYTACYPVSYTVHIATSAHNTTAQTRNVAEGGTTRSGRRRLVVCSLLSMHIHSLSIVHTLQDPLLHQLVRLRTVLQRMLKLVLTDVISKWPSHTPRPNAPPAASASAFPCSPPARAQHPCHLCTHKRVSIAGRVYAERHMRDAPLRMLRSTSSLRSGRWLSCFSR